MKKDILGPIFETMLQGEMDNHIENKVLFMYAKSMSERDIADTIEDIYGFEISHESTSNITDRVLTAAEEW